MLPIIGPDLGFNDFEGALLTTGYSYLYALALVPMGLLADRVDRPKLLAGGLALWSGLTVAAAHVGSFQELILARVGFAAAQAAQNPISFSLIPDLFPSSKSTAMAVYNCAIYLGRALSFGAVIQAKNMQMPAMDAAAGAVADAARQAGEAAAVAAGGIMVPLDKLDLSRVSILYMNGDNAMIAPVYSYGLELHMLQAGTSAAAAVVHDTAWRDVLTMLAVPGFLISGLLLLTVADPKKKGQQQQEQQQQQQQQREQERQIVQQKGRRAVQTIDITASSASSEEAKGSVAAAGVISLLTSSAFMTVTLAAALNDVGSYAFLAWQSTFYERVYHLEPATYAPMLAAVLPIGGIVGGVGGGLLADALSKIGQRYWLTVGASMLSAPLIAQSVLAGTSEESFLALMLGFGLAEAWRAPSAVLIRSIAPASMGSTASALYLSVRNLVGGLGPLAVAKLADVVGLQRAMLLAPACYAASGLLFLAAELILKQQGDKALAQS
jgi:MFS family permease